MDVMGSLVAVGWLEPKESNNPAKPTHAWTVNPAVHTVFKARAEKERVARQQAKGVLGPGHEHPFKEAESEGKPLMRAQMSQMSQAPWPEYARKHPLQGVAADTPPTSGSPRCVAEWPGS